MEPLKIAFTSCMDTVNHGEQPGWRNLAREKPNAIVLLGDSIYMDYGKKIAGIFISGGPRPASEANGTPALLSVADFSSRMHQHYRQQYDVPGFLDSIRGCKGNVHAIWDDHDFTWNNSRGAGPAGPALVPEAQRRFSTAHYRTWQKALNDQPIAYPSNTVNSGDPRADDGGIGRRRTGRKAGGQRTKPCCTNSPRVPWPRGQQSSVRRRTSSAP